MVGQDHHKEINYTFERSKDFNLIFLLDLLTLECGEFCLLIWTGEIKIENCFTENIADETLEFTPILNEIKRLTYSHRLRSIVYSISPNSIKLFTVQIPLKSLL